MKNKLGTACMALGAVLLAAALALLLWNREDDRRAGTAAAQALAELTAQMETGQDAGSAVYAGVLSIPALELELPVMADWSDERLKTAPCRYAGSAAGGDLVIAGHNYTRHFGRLNCLEPGEPVYFTGMDGTVYSYRVAAVEILEATAVEEMTSGDYALTLFTCTYSGQSRIAVRCGPEE